jgi:hypothetical protein
VVAEASLAPLPKVDIPVDLPVDLPQHRHAGSTARVSRGRLQRQLGELRTRLPGSETQEERDRIERQIEALTARIERLPRADRGRGR